MGLVEKREEIVEHAKRLIEKAIALDKTIDRGFMDWIDWDHFLSDAVYIYVEERGLEIVTKTGLVLKVVIKRNNEVGIEIDSLCYCNCVC